MQSIHEDIAKDNAYWGADSMKKWFTRYHNEYPDFPKDIRVVRDVRYGPDDRNHLDVYVPNGRKPDKPVLVFVFGGAFVSGDKALSEKNYANVGHYFANQGLVTVVVNYRLVPHVKYPGGAQDVFAAREWIFHNIRSEEYGQGSKEKVFLFGHSSGGAHIATDLFAAGDSSLPTKDPLWPPIAGVMLLGVPMWFDGANPMRKQMFRGYFGSADEEVWQPKTILSLFRNLPDDSPIFDSRNLPLYIGIVEWEFKATTDGNLWFLDAYRQKSKPAGTLPSFHVLKGHNHLSGILSIGTEDTAQAEHLLQFIKQCLGSRFGDLTA